MQFGPDYREKNTDAAGMRAVLNCAVRAGLRRKKYRCGRNAEVFMIQFGPDSRVKSTGSGRDVVGRGAG